MTTRALCLLTTVLALGCEKTSSSTSATSPPTNTEATSDTSTEIVTGGDGPDLVACRLPEKVACSGVDPSDGSPATTSCTWKSPCTAKQTLFLPKDLMLPQPYPGLRSETTVKLDGVMIDTASYMADAKTQTLIFSEGNGPDKGVEVEVTIAQSHVSLVERGGARCDPDVTGTGVGASDGDPEVTGAQSYSSQELFCIWQGPCDTDRTIDLRELGDVSEHGVFVKTGDVELPPDAVTYDATTKVATITPSFCPAPDTLLSVMVYNSPGRIGTAAECDQMRADLIAKGAAMFPGGFGSAATNACTTADDCTVTTNHVPFVPVGTAACLQPIAKTAVPKLDQLRADPAVTALLDKLAQTLCLDRSPFGLRSCQETELKCVNGLCVN